MDAVQYAAFHVAPLWRDESAARRIGSKPVYCDLRRDDLQQIADEANVLVDRFKWNIIRHLGGESRAADYIEHVELQAPGALFYRVLD